MKYMTNTKYTDLLSVAGSLELIQSGSASLNNRLLQRANIVIVFSRNIVYTKRQQWKRNKNRCITEFLLAINSNAVKRYWILKKSNTLGKS
jgi:hypothetical protein